MSRRMNAGLLLFLAVALAATVAAAAAAIRPDATEPAPAKPPKADIRGKVSSVSPVRAKGLVGRMLVEGVKEKDTQYDKASVTLTSETKIYKWADGKKKYATFADVKVGSKVQCNFTGPVAESYPVQARASEVLILAGPPPAKK